MREVDDTSEERLLKVLKKLKRGNSVRLEKIFIEFLKRGEETLVRWLDYLMCIFTMKIFLDWRVSCL